jgi:hypothetical protein
MILFREAGPGDFEHVQRLYRQLQPADPVLQDGSDAAAFAQILDSPGLRLFVLEVDGVVAATTYSSHRQRRLATPVSVAGRRRSGPAAGSPAAPSTGAPACRTPDYSGPAHPR